MAQFTTYREKSEEQSKINSMKRTASLCRRLFLILVSLQLFVSYHFALWVANEPTIIETQAREYLQTVNSYNVQVTVCKALHKQIWTETQQSKLSRINTTFSCYHERYAFHPHHCICYTNSSISFPLQMRTNLFAVFGLNDSIPSKHHKETSMHPLIILKTVKKTSDSYSPAPHVQVGYVVVVRPTLASIKGAYLDSIPEPPAQVQVSSLDSLSSPPTSI